MSIEDAIVEQWGNASTLNALLPSTAVSTGESLSDEKIDPSDDLPRARLIVDLEDIENTNTTQIENHLVIVEVFVTSNTAINSIRAAIHIRGVFHHAGWQTSELNIESCQVVNSEKEQLPDQIWKLTTELEIKSNAI